MNEGVKFDSGKPRYDLIPVMPLEELAKLYGWAPANGKYPERNWELGMDYSKLYRAIISHATAFWNGEDNDQETGLSHLAAVAFSAFALLEYRLRKTGKDNRPHTYTNNSALSVGQRLERALFESDYGFYAEPAPENIEKFPEAQNASDIPDGLEFVEHEVKELIPEDNWLVDKLKDLSPKTTLVACPDCGSMTTLNLMDTREHIKGVYRRYKCSECEERFWTLDYVHVTEFPNFDAVVPAIDKVEVTPVPEGRVIGGPALEEFDAAVKEKRPLKKIIKTKAKKWNPAPIAGNEEF